MDPYRTLLQWLTEDREGRALEITVTANDPEYREIGGNDEEAIWSWHYTIEASMQCWYGGEPDEDDPPTMHETYVGHGEGLDDAAAQVLAVLAEVSNDAARDL